MTGEAEVRRPMMSGHCANARFNHDTSKMTPHGREAHARCAGGQRANPAKVFQPCACGCHLPAPADAELFDCGECGKIIIEAPRWPCYPGIEDEPGDPRYTHMDWTLNDAGEVVGGTGRALGEECYTTPRVSRNTEPVEDRVKDCTRCGDEFTPKGRERICPECKAAELSEKDDEVESVMAELDEVLGEDEEFDAMLAEFDGLDED
jgi:hypothetical protein